MFSNNTWFLESWDPPAVIWRSLLGEDILPSEIWMLASLADPLTCKSLSGLSVPIPTLSKSASQWKSGTEVDVLWNTLKSILPASGLILTAGLVA